MNVCGGAIALYVCVCVFVCTSLHMSCLKVYVYVYTKHMYTQMNVCAHEVLYICVYTDRQTAYTYNVN